MGDWQLWLRGWKQPLTQETATESGAASTQGAMAFSKAPSSSLSHVQLRLERVEQRLLLWGWLKTVGEGCVNGTSIKVL